MLTTVQKATILRRSGIETPDIPVKPAAADQRTGRPLGEAAKSFADTTAFDLYAAWVNAIDNLFVSYVAARAAKGLRDAEEARTLEKLREMAMTPASSRPTRRAQWA